MIALILMAAVGAGSLARSMEADLERKTRRLSERFEHVMRQAGEAILLSSPEGAILEASQKASEVYGFSSAEFQNLTLADLSLPAPGGQPVIGGADDEVMEVIQRRKDGAVFPADIHSRLVSLGDESIRVTFARDITQQKQEDAERHAIARMIAPFSSPQDFRSLMSDLAITLQDISGCEAVGIRLREGDDFPYYQTLGFPPAFVQAERHLCAYGPDGGLLRDAQGNPVLECMCGNILCGRFDPAKPFFTPHGSFISNGTTALLASTTEADRQARTRNRCNGEGYESVALIPMRNGSEVFGLLQFNDRQPNRFTPRLVSLFERMADNLAVALARRQAQEALRKSEERIKHSMDGLIEGCQIIGFDWRFLYVNDAAARQGRKAKEAFLGRTIMEVLPGIETTELFRVLKRCLEERNTEHLVNEYSFADGSKGWFELSVQAVEEGIFLLSVDITERRKAEENLKENRALLNSIIDGTTDAIYVKDLEGRYLLFNSAAEAVVGKPRAAVLDRDDTFLFPPEEAADIMARDRKVMETGSIGTSEETRTNAKGRVATFLITKGPLYDEAGRMTGIFGISRDITDRVRLEEERRQLEAQLTQSQKMDSLGSLAGGVAHDMNNVLAAIQAIATLHLHRAPANSPLLTDLKTITKACERGGLLVKGLLGFARKGLAEERELDLNALVREEVALLARTTLQKIELQVDLENDLPPVMGDPSALNHALMNLCVNAVDAMPEGGILTLRTRRDGNEMVRLEVADTGTGMSKEVQEKALDPFFTTKPQGQGTGLGLPLVYGTVKAHRGRMEIQSEPGQGTRIILHLPTCMPQTKEWASIAPEDSVRNQQSLSILLVDDDELIRMAVPALLEELGCRASAVAGGAEAVSCLQQGLHPDVVILDMNMPGMSGAETLPRLRAIRPDLPILLSTGRADQDALNLVAAYPNVTLLSKPFSLVEMQEILSRIGRPQPGVG
jgi:PAS domain S-box-containing protein